MLSGQAYHQDNDKITNIQYRYEQMVNITSNGKSKVVLGILLRKLNMKATSSY